MRVFLAPTGLHSRAMQRVANALTKYAPPDITITPTLGAADLHILHVINADAIPYAQDLLAKGKQYSVIQYCYKTAGGEFNDWWETWRESVLVWSYYNLTIESQEIGFNFYHAPLGIDNAFHVDGIKLKENLVLTTGYVSGPGAEAIEEVWLAAERAGINAIHVGPDRVSGIKRQPVEVQTLSGLTDERLARLYQRSKWVASLRHIEGFELPAAEGLACGARPLLFDQPDLRHWYGDLAIYIPECHGDDLINKLHYIFSSSPIPVPTFEKSQVLSRFNWSVIAKEFWVRLLQGVK